MRCCAPRTSTSRTPRPAVRGVRFSAGLQTTWQGALSGGARTVQQHHVLQEAVQQVPLGGHLAGQGTDLSAGLAGSSGSRSPGAEQPHPAYSPARPHLARGQQDECAPPVALNVGRRHPEEAHKAAIVLRLQGARGAVANAPLSAAGGPQ